MSRIDRSLRLLRELERARLASYVVEAEYAVVPASSVECAVLLGRLELAVELLEQAERAIDKHDEGSGYFRKGWASRESSDVEQPGQVHGANSQEVRR